MKYGRHGKSGDEWRLVSQWKRRKYPPSLPSSSSSASDRPHLPLPSTPPFLYRACPRHRHVHLDFFLSRKYFPPLSPSQKLPRSCFSRCSRNLAFRGEKNSWPKIFRTKRFHFLEETKSLKEGYDARKVALEREEVLLKAKRRTVFSIFYLDSRLEVMKQFLALISEQWAPEYIRQWGHFIRGSSRVVFEGGCA